MRQLPGPIVKERAARLRAAGEAALAAELASRVGGETDVLIEHDGMGRAEFYAAVRFAAPGAAGSIRRMRLVDRSGDSLVGVPIA
jgi:threonylcarbamoyladenosine tRNA methylthiotransferase MtaB